MPEVLLSQVLFTYIERHMIKRNHCSSKMKMKRSAREADLRLQRMQQAVALQEGDKSGDGAGSSNIQIKNNWMKRVDNWFEML